MPISFRCGICNAAIDVPDTTAASRAKCPACGASGSVPAASTIAPTPPRPAVEPAPKYVGEEWNTGLAPQSSDSGWRSDSARMLLVVTVLVLIGSGVGLLFLFSKSDDGGKVTTSTSPASQKKAADLPSPTTTAEDASATTKMTAEQRARWNTVRRQEQGGYHLLAYHAQFMEWMVWQPKVFSWGASLGSAGTANEDKATWAAGNPKFDAAVLVDMAADPDPNAVAWFVRDGKGVKITEQAPTPDLEKSLQRFLFRLQAGGGDAKR